LYNREGNANLERKRCTDGHENNDVDTITAAISLTQKVKVNLDYCYSLESSIFQVMKLTPRVFVLGSS